MTTRLVSWIHDLRSTYWAVPSGMTLIAGLLAFGVVELDSHWSNEGASSVRWIYTGDAAGARSVLSSIAASTITVAGTTFSITIAALTLASSQFGPRLLRNFMRDTANQVVLGTFIGTFLYCVLVLRRVQSLEDANFVPNIAVTVAIVFGIASIGVLIFFIHHVSSSIQASHVIAATSHELERAIDRLFPEGLGAESDSQETLSADQMRALTAGTAPRTVRASSSGYVRALDGGGLLRTASGAGIIVSLLVRPGDFVFEGQAVAHAWPGDRLDDDVLDHLAGVFVLGIERTEEQDARFPMSQLVEIAVRALSPGTNDPFTAINAIDRLGQALSRLASRDYPSPYRRDNQGTIRVIAEPDGFDPFLELACRQIRSYARGSATVTIRLLEMLAAVAASTGRAHIHASIMREAAFVGASADEHLEPDANEIRAALARVVEACTRAANG